MGGHSGFPRTWGNLSWNAASSLAFPTLPELRSFRQPRGSGWLLPLRSSARTAAPLRPASLEAERPLPPNRRNRLEGAWRCGTTLDLIQEVRSRGPGGSLQWQPFCLLGAVSRAQLSAVPIHTACSGLWFHLLHNPPIPWRLWSLGRKEVLWHSRTLNQAAPTSAALLASPPGTQAQVLWVFPSPQAPTAWRIPSVLETQPHLSSLVKLTMALLCPEELFAILGSSPQCLAVIPLPLCLFCGTWTPG